MLPDGGRFILIFLSGLVRFELEFAMHLSSSKVSFDKIYQV